jgi:hypothetical protein
MQNSHKRVVIISGDTLPLPGLPTTGAGLRAWGLGKGLEANGHQVHPLMPESAIGKYSSTINLTELRPYLYSQTDKARSLHHRLIEIEPEIIILQHWPLASTLQTKPNVPVVIDFHGPVMLESLYQNRVDYQHLFIEKLRVIAEKGNYFTCAGENQRHYFYAWLMMAGFDVREDLIGVVPVCLSPDQPIREPFSDDIHFVYGGVYLPWQDPVLPLETLLNTIEVRGRGQLDFFGGQHTFLKLPSGPFEQLKARIEQSVQAKNFGMVPHAHLIDHYRRAHVAFDLMQRNPERELAFTTRTVEYLWCGLPVVYNNYGELADYIKAYDAGWTLDPQDAGAIRAVIEEILDNPAIVAAKSANASRLAQERLNWKDAVAPLDQFCRQPRPHKPKQFISLGELHTQKNLVNVTNASLPYVRRYRRSWPARLTALVKHSGKALLRRRFYYNRLDRPAYVLPELTQGQLWGQSFVAEENYLSAITLLIGIHGRMNTCDLMLHLHESPTAAEDLRTVSVNAAFLQDVKYYQFSFDPIPNSKGKSLFFCLESPDGVIGDAVSLFAYSDRLDERHQRYLNGKGVDGELVYTLSYYL